MTNRIFVSCVQIYFILKLRKQWFVKELLMYIKPLILRNNGFLPGFLCWPEHLKMFGIRVDERQKPHAYKTKL